MAKGYEINEKDIKGAINFLKYTDPEHATPEMAIELLEISSEKLSYFSTYRPK